MLSPIALPLLAMVALPPRLPAGPGAAAPSEPPPGLIAIAGGRVTVGTDSKEITEMIRDHKDQSGALAGETPQQKVEVDDFYLMVTEVTNEQYALFVRASNAKPPIEWGVKVIDEARSTFLQDQGKRIAEASARGERLERKKFDEHGWWDRHWQEVQWEVPQELLAHPVTWVDYQGATDYARWAGLRLMTEFEYARAARGDGSARYPWGDEWRDASAATFESGAKATLPVGTYPDGAVGGVYDLVGNVWEWTSSPYVGFKGYSSIKVKLDRNQTVEGLAPFDPSKCVLVGGSFQTPQIAARIATRMGTIRDQATNAVGFRCAASTLAGLDAAHALLEADVSLNVLPDDVEFFPQGALVARRWSSSPGTASDVQQQVGGARKKGRLEHYAVIERYDQVLFVPAANANAGSLKDLSDRSAERPVHLGVLSTTVPVASPALLPGSYHVAWRAAGKAPAAQGDNAIDWSRVTGFDEKHDLYVFLDMQAAPVACMPAAPMLYDRQKDRGRVALEPFVPPTAEELAKLEKEGKPAPEPLDTVHLHVVVPGASKGKAFLIDVGLRYEDGVGPDEAWRLDA